MRDKKGLRGTLLSSCLMIIPLVLSGCGGSIVDNQQSKNSSMQFLSSDSQKKKDASSSENGSYKEIKVTEVGDTRLYVTVIDKGTSGLQNGTPAYVSTDFDGYTAPSVGDFVIVEFDSMVQEIYPPIIPNVFDIVLCDANGNQLK